MAMDGSTLGTAIGTAMYDAIPSNIKAQMTAAAKADTCSALIDAWTLAAQCIVAHITTNAQVTVNAGIAVTAGSCVGATTAPGTGTIS